MNPNQRTVKVLIADDHALLREGLIKILSIEPYIEVVGEAKNGAEAIKLARTVDIDVILMDINMPEVNGIEATKVIKAERPDIYIIALTIHDDEDYLFELIRAGISGYVLKDVNPDDLVNTILGVAAGKSFIPPSLTTKVFEEFNRLIKLKERPNYGLTNRELDVLKQVARGLSNKEIADVLYISEKTVKNHLTSIFQKLGVNDRTQAALFSIKHNLVDI